MKWCVLGSGGCFGQNLVQYLLNHKEEVIGIGRNPRKPKCFSLGIEYPYYAYHTTYEYEYIAELLKAYKPDVVVNYAAQGEGAASFKADSWRFYETNSMGLARLIEHIPFERFIHIGTSELYGSVDHAARESDPIQPTSPYAASKAAFDLHLIALHKVKGLKMNIIRPSNCYCPGQQLHRIIPKAMLHGMKNEPLPLHGGGVAEKSYLHATDLSSAVFLVATLGRYGEVYNVAPDEPTSIRNVVEMCGEALGRPIPIQVVGDRTGQDARYWLDASKIQALDWKQKINWTHGLFEMAEWVKAYPELLDMPTEFRMRA